MTNYEDDELLKDILKDPKYNLNDHELAPKYNNNDSSQPIYLKEDELKKLIQETDTLYGTDIYNIDNQDYSKLLDTLDQESMTRKNKIVANKKKHYYFKSNIDFVNYFEKDFIKSTLESLKNKDKVYQLQNYRKHSKKIKLVVLDIIKKENLANRMYKYSNAKLITSIAIFDDLMFAGNSIGIIRMFTLQKEYDLKTFSLKEIEKMEGNVKSVSCMNVSPDGEYLLAGYSNGFVVLWEINSNNPKKFINSLHKTCVLDIKFLSVSNKKRWEFISTEADGSVQHVVIKDGLFSVSVDNSLLLKNKIPFHSIKPFRLMENANNLKNVQDICSEALSTLMIGFASLDKVIVLDLYEKKILFEINKPVWLKDSHVPECSFGFGYIPDSNINSSDDLTINNNPLNNSFINPNDKNIIYSKNNNISNTNTNVINNTSINNEYNNNNANRLNGLFAVSWGKVIFLYSMFFSNKRPFITFSIIAHYVNNSPLIRMDFLSDSILYLFDKKKLVKVVNTSLLTPGEVKMDLSTEIPTPIVDLNRNPEIEEGILVDNDLQMQTYLIDPNDNSLKATYNNCIVNIPKSIYVLGKTKFNQLKLLNWEQCLNELFKNKSEWNDALSLGLDIYHGRSNALADIPTDKYIREVKVGSELKHLLHHFVVMHTANNKNTLSNDFSEKLTNCINICIEFCLELGDVEYLLNTLQPLFDHVGYGDLFIEKLEPFILTDPRITKQLQQMTISKIIEIYTKANRLEALSQILIHLDIKSMNVDYVKDICQANNLITPLIYISTYSISEDYFTPILIIHNAYNSSKQIDRFNNYSDLMERNLSINEIENSKQYNGHKLLWYIYHCFNGKKIFGEEISENKFQKILFYILHWIFFENNHLEELLLFDSKSFFELMEIIFKEDKIKSLIENFGSKEEFIKEIQANNMFMEKQFTITLNIKSPDSSKESSTDNNKNVIFCLSNLLDYLIQYSNKLKSPLKNMYEFIIKIASCYEGLQKSLIIEAAKYLLELEVDNSLNDRSFNIHIEEFSQTIIDMIIFKKEFDKNDFYSLLKSASLSPYIMVKVFLQKQLKDYKGCLKTLLAPENTTNNSTQKQKTIFDWINDSLYELESNSDPNFTILKKEVLDNLNHLAKLNIDFVTKLVEKWFENDQLFVISKLDMVKDLQLKYVENIIDKFKEEADYNQESGKKVEQYHSLLKLQIKLLCKLKPNEVLPNLIKRGQAYPVSDCLDYCLKYKVHDGAIYLKQTLGEIKDALEIAIKLLNTNVDEIFANLRSPGFQERIHLAKLKDFDDKLKLCIDILEKNTDKTDYSEEPEMWFILLEKLYSISSQVGLENDRHKNNSTESFYKDYENRISDNIKTLLEKMCSYVSIHLIISVSISKNLIIFNVNINVINFFIIECYREI